MARQIIITAQADDRRAGMTLGELEAFVADALAADLAPSTRIEVTTGFRQQITRLATKPTR